MVQHHLCSYTFLLTAQVPPPSIPCGTQLISETSPSTLVSPRPSWDTEMPWWLEASPQRLGLGHSWAVEAPHVAFCCGNANFHFLLPQYRRDDGTFSVKMDLCGPAVGPGNQGKNVDQSTIRSNCRSLVDIVHRQQQLHNFTDTVA